jgi:hypothetical protein
MVMSASDSYRLSKMFLIEYLFPMRPGLYDTKTSAGIIFLMLSVSWATRSVRAEHDYVDINHVIGPYLEPAQCTSNRNPFP